MVSTTRRFFQALMLSASGSDSLSSSSKLDNDMLRQKAVTLLVRRLGHSQVHWQADTSSRRKRKKRKNTASQKGRLCFRGNRKTCGGTGGFSARSRAWLTTKQTP